MAYKKYNAKKTVIDGIAFDSLVEGGRYQELKLLLAAGEITDLRVHPRFVVWQQGKEKIIYEGDFQYSQGGEIVVEDTKGFKTQVYLMKRKMFRAAYPDIDFREISV